MTREEIMEYVAEQFGIEPNEDGEHDIRDYDWISGCYINGKWLCLAKVVKMIENIVE